MAKLKKKSKLKPKTKLVPKVVESSDLPPQTAPKKYNKLRDVVDMEKLFTMLYSGVEQEKYFNILYDLGIRDFLISYHYMKGKRSDVDRFRNKDLKFFIDSGAYTYQANEEYQNYTVEQWETQIVEYLNWARANRDIIFAIANLDLENLVGVDVVTQWNRKYFEPFMLETGIPVCFIWHPVMGEDAWDRYCERYPYVGMSWVADSGSDLDFNFGKKMLENARKHGAVVHGMGMTRTALLPKLSFYTCDSTTWMVGVQYGEINFWTGKKMTRLKKEKWKGDYLNRILDLGVNDVNKLLEEDNEELIRANVQAFILAENYIRDRMKSQMYWLRPDVEVRASLSDVTFPDNEWIFSDREDPSYYARKLNINHEHPDPLWIEDTVIAATVICNWDNPTYAEAVASVKETEFIAQCHDLYVNSICGSDEERLEELTKFFTDVVLGLNDKLLLAGTNFDLTVKERDHYLEEESVIVNDLTESELKERLSGFLPNAKEGAIAPDITALDDEIFKGAGIVPVRDEKGRFVKGQVTARKPKQIYSELFPKMSCDKCYAAQRCVEYKAGYACAYNKLFDRFNTRDMGDLVEAMQSMVSLNLSRMQRVAIFETMDGGMPDGQLTSFIDQNMRLVSQLAKMYETGSSEILKHTKVVRADGTSEETTSVTNPKEGSILEKLFLQPKTNDFPDDDIMDVSSVDLNPTD